MLKSVDILIAEDNDSEIELLHFALKKNNIADVHIVHDGAEVLDFLFCTGDYTERSPGDLPKIIVLDVKMPKVDGLSVLTQIRSDADLQTIPVIMLSNSAEQSDKEIAIQQGANDYLHKPIDIHEFVMLLKNALNRWMPCIIGNLCFFYLYSQLDS